MLHSDVNSALIGNPTDHSVSDLLYYELSKIKNPDSKYKHIKVNIDRNDLQKRLATFRELNLLGLNVTLPYKREIMPYLDSIDLIAQEVDAVNTIKYSSKGLIGHNTDWYGIYYPLEKKLKKKNPTICILGSGGASRAAIYAAQQLTFDITVVYRDNPISDNTQSLITQFENSSVKFLNYQHISDIVFKSDVIINTTSAGMINKELTPFDLNALINVNLDNKIFFEAVFNPVKTPLMKFFEEFKVECIDGLWMMIYQAIKAFSIWTESEFHYEESELEFIHEKLKKELSTYEK